MVVLYKYLNINKKSTLSVDYVNEYFSEVSKELVINRPNINSYSTFYVNFITPLSDSIDTKDFSQKYHDLLGYYYYTTFDYQKAFYHFDKSYKLNSENIYTKQMLYELINKKLQFINDFEGSIDSLEQYNKKYSFLLTNVSYQEYLVNCYSRLISIILESGNITSFKRTLSRFEKCVKDNKINETKGEWVSNIYLQIASFYYRIHFYNKQEEILKKGLELVPNSSSLQSSLQSFQSSKKELIEWAKKNHYDIDEKPYSLDNESLSVLKSIANNNRKTINLNCDKYLKNTEWVYESFVINNRIVNLTPQEQVKVIFKNDNSSVIKDREGERSGTWTFNRNESTIRFFDSLDSATTNIVIYEIDSTTIKSIIYNDGISNKFITILKNK